MEQATYRVLLDTGNVNCKASNVLNSRIQRYLVANGHAMTRDPQQADYAVVHVCTLTAAAEQVSRALLGRYHAYPDLKLVLMGCMQDDNAAVRSASERALFMGSPSELEPVFGTTPPFEAVREAYLDQGALESLYATGGQPVRRSRTAQTVDRALHGLLTTCLPPSARLVRIYEEIVRKDKFYVEIGRGCAGSCTYCVMPGLHHEIRSRPREEILADIARYTEGGTHLSLVADDCGCYGRERGDSLDGLVRGIAEAFPSHGIELSFVNPQWLVRERDTYVALFRDTAVESACFPVQSGSDRILHLMNRHYTAAAVREAVRCLREVSPEALIWTHFMTGFPGETQRDFLASVALQKDFDFWFYFPYSERPGTPSAALEDKVSPTTARWRAGVLKAGGYRHFMHRFARDLAGRT